MHPLKLTGAVSTSSTCRRNSVTAAASYLGSSPKAVPPTSFPPHASKLEPRSEGKYLKWD
jgi:hypothetical protein